AVAVSGNNLIVGARWASTTASASGAAYIFQKDSITWTETTFLYPNDGVNKGFFGASVDINQKFAIVGASQDNHSAIRSGSVYAYEFDGLGWVPTTKLIASDGNFENYLGYNIAISDSIALVGTLGVGTNNEKGSAYFFDVRNTLEVR